MISSALEDERSPSCSCLGVFVSYGGRHVCLVQVFAGFLMGQLPYVLDERLICLIASAIAAACWSWEGIFLAKGCGGRDDAGPSGDRRRHVGGSNCAAWCWKSHGSITALRMRPAGLICIGRSRLLCGFVCDSSKGAIWRACLLWPVHGSGCGGDRRRVCGLAAYGTRSCGGRTWTRETSGGMSDWLRRTI